MLLLSLPPLPPLLLLVVVVLALVLVLLLPLPLQPLLLLILLLLLPPLLQLLLLGPCVRRVNRVHPPSMPPLLRLDLLKNEVLGGAVGLTFPVLGPATFSEWKRALLDPVPSIAANAASKDHPAHLAAGLGKVPALPIQNDTAAAAELEVREVQLPAHHVELGAAARCNINVWRLGVVRGRAYHAQRFLQKVPLEILNCGLAATSGLDEFPVAHIRHACAQCLQSHHNCR